MISKTPFITLEGGEGSGKSTQIRLLKHWLESEKGKSVALTREPGGTPGAEKIRDLLVIGKDDNRWSAATETLLLMAGRCDHLEKFIRPQLREGKWVLSDRFVDSTYAYQACGRGLESEKIAPIYQFIAGDFMPDLTIVFDIDPKLGLLRAMKGKGRNLAEDRFESIDFNFHKRLRAGYLEMAKKEPKRFTVISIKHNTTPEDIQATLRTRIEKRFKI